MDLKSIKLEISLQEANYLLKLIARQPLENVLSLFSKVKSQVEMNIRDSRRLRVDTNGLAEAMAKNEKYNS